MENHISILNHANKVAVSRNTITIGFLIKQLVGCTRLYRNMMHARLRLFGGLLMDGVVGRLLIACTIIKGKKRVLYTCIVHASPKTKNMNNFHLHRFAARKKEHTCDARACAPHRVLLCWSRGYVALILAFVVRKFVFVSQNVANLRYLRKP
jgi:hypothetical protein